MDSLFTVTRWKMQELCRHIKFEKKDQSQKTDYDTSGMELKTEVQCLVEGLIIVCLFA